MINDEGKEEGVVAMESNQNERWGKIELVLLRSYLLFHTGSSLLELFARKINEFGHSLSLW